MELVNELYAFCSANRCVAIDATEDADKIGTVDRAGTIAVLKEAVEALVRMLSPFAPHMCEELWEALGHPGGIVAAGWPVFDKAVAKASEIVVPVQVNGKVRGRVTVPADAGDDQLREAAPQHQVQSGRVQHARDDRQEQFHVTPPATRRRSA